MKITLYYNFHQEYFIDHGEVVLISEHDFPYDYVQKGDDIERVPFGSADDNNNESVS